MTPAPVIEMRNSRLPPAAAGNPCQRCQTRCCEEFTVLITPDDVRRLCRNLAAPPEAIVRRIPFQSEFSAYSDYTFSLGGTRRWLLALRRRGRGCLFAIPLGSAGQRCGVHPFRPAVCRCYPLELTGRTLTMVQEALCPEPWHPSPEEARSFRAALKDFNDHYRTYASILNHWHSRELPRLADSGRAGHGPTFTAFLEVLLHSDKVLYP